MLEAGFCTVLCFEMVMEEIAEVIDEEKFDDNISDEVDEPALYLKNTFIEGLTVTETLFPIETWN